MRFDARVSYKMPVTGEILSWHSRQLLAKDHADATEVAIHKVRRLKRRPIDIIGVTVRKLEDGRG